MNIDNILLLRTILLFVPYLIVIAIFYFKVRDNFFLKPRSHIQLNLMMILLVVSFIESVYWHISWNKYSFLNFAINGTEGSSDTLIVLLGILAAVLGWLYTSRGQDLTSKRSHSIQTLMASRLSEAYANHANFATGVYVRTRNERGDSAVITMAEFLNLKQKERNAIFYQLNYFEFIAVGIRYGDLDENLMKNTLNSIIANNFIFFGEVIKTKQEGNPRIYEHLTALYNRWNCKK
ncbi:MULTISPECIES: DUF4760 domain-containing protein [Acinetobacter calcoaceticus/baumannii complex]|uniref:DUF4760 domain-containing protein n=1 Tax=Acinetobacter calcoaceticus/baumannii complex TaxID=909768 RepID=UPI00124FCA22|nr:DUF4760 domain-containing protein [Acinetobacter calcoaceticus]